MKYKGYPKKTQSVAQKSRKVTALNSQLLSNYSFSPNKWWSGLKYLPTLIGYSGCKIKESKFKDSTPTSIVIRVMHTPWL